MSLVSRKNQITIPAEVMRAAGLAAGDDVRVRSAGPGRIELIKTDELVDEFAGMLDSSAYPAGYLEGSSLRMAVVVFDSDVLIGFLNRDDAHHSEAVRKVRAALAPGTRRLLCAVNYAEILIGPIRVVADESVKQMLNQFSIEIVNVDKALAEHAAVVRVRTNLKLPDAFALATSIQAQQSGREPVELATFDERLRKAHATLHR